MAKKKGDLKKIDTSKQDEMKLVEECAQHESDSYSYFGNVRQSWDEKESMLLGVPEDSLTKVAKSKVNNPILANAVIERSARVMAQNATGKAFAVSKDDIGKNMIMNLLLGHYQKNANEEYSHLLKLRLLNVFSNVYGSFFGLVPWRVNRLDGYVGPELLTINMRDVRPQPGRKSPDKSDWFGVRSVSSVEWLEKQDGEIWNKENIAAFKAELQVKEQAKGKGNVSSARTGGKDTQSYIERSRYPNVVNDSAYPEIELFTEYRHDKWITWTPQNTSNDKSRPWILRVLENPYPKGRLPIVVKHAFPLVDSMIGLGEMERGKTLQFALNSLINLYLDGVKYSIFPPLHINIDEVTASSIKWGAGEKWYMQKPNQSVQVMNMQSSQWLNTFQSTYGFLQSAIINLAGSSQVSEQSGIESSFGKTPEAIKYMGFKESARDEWDRFMMEDTLNQVYTRWVDLITHKLDAPVGMRIFESEIKDVQKQFPEEDIMSVFKSGKRGELTVTRKQLNDDEKNPTNYDYELDSGSTMKASSTDEGMAAADVLKDLTQAPWILKDIREHGGDIDIMELYKRRMIAGGVKDWDRILKKMETNTSAGDKVPGADQMSGQVTPQIGEALAQELASRSQAEGGTQISQETQVPAQIPVTATVQPVPETTKLQQTTVPQTGNFNDQEIAAAAEALLGGIRGIPPTATA